MGCSYTHLLEAGEKGCLLKKLKEKMNMDFFEDMTRRVRKLDIIDIELAQTSSMFFALIIAKLIPGLMNLNILWFIVLLVLCSIKPIYVFWIKE